MFSGLNQIKLSKSIDSKETNKGNKYVGIFSIIVGLVLIVGYIIEFVL